MAETKSIKKEHLPHLDMARGPIRFVVSDEKVYIAGADFGLAYSLVFEIFGYNLRRVI